MKITLKIDKMTECGLMSEDQNIEIDNDEFFNEFMNSLFDKCVECDGTGKILDPYYRGAPCWSANCDEGKKLNWNGEKFLQFFKENIKWEIK